MPVPSPQCREEAPPGTPALGESAGVPGDSDSQPPVPEPVLCGHCGRTATNGISCQGMCVADSGY
ncbi:MAG: hypothetical protein ACKO22_12580 [Cyanobium sp.]